MKEVIYLISKAFDTVDHTILLSKHGSLVLKKEKISGLSLIEANRNKKSFHRSVDTNLSLQLVNS